MNVCIVSKYNCTFDEFKEGVEQAQDENSAWISEYELVKVNDHDHKSILLMNVTDMEAMRAYLTTPEMKQWDEENGCVDIIYSMERWSRLFHVRTDYRICALTRLWMLLPNRNKIVVKRLPFQGEQR